MKWAFAWVLAASLAGCLSPDSQTAASLAVTSEPTQRPVVVALIDTGINPYHEAFAAPAGGFALPEADAIPARLSTAGEDWKSRVEADKGLWDGLESGTLYRFEGTRIMAISFGDRGGPVILDPVGHGTHTSSIVARDAPHALLVMVQVDSRICVEDPSCLVRPSMVAGMAWAAEQPWIDVISVSMGVPGNAPDPAALHPNVAQYVAASRKAWESGKLVVNGAGNDPSVTLTDFFDGPAWVICVGGAQASNHGETTLAARGVDVVADFATRVADPESLNDTGESAGTSLSTPAVAAALAEAIRLGPGLPPLGVERRDALRAALNATAVPFSATQWTPTAPEPTFNGVFSSTNPTLLGGVQGGWGYVDASLAPLIAQAASTNGSHDAVATPRALWQTQWQAARVAYWG